MTSMRRIAPTETRTTPPLPPKPPLTPVPPLALITVAAWLRLVARRCGPLLAGGGPTAKPIPTRDRVALPPGNFAERPLSFLLYCPCPRPPGLQLCPRSRHVSPTLRYGWLVVPMPQPYLSRCRSIAMHFLPCSRCARRFPPRTVERFLGPRPHLSTFS